MTTNDDDARFLEQQEPALDAELVARARLDVNLFIECVGRYQWKHHPDGRVVEPWERIVQQPVHEEIQTILDESPWTIFLTFPGIGKTTQVAIREAWELGHDSNRRIMVFSQHIRRGDPALRMSRLIRSAVEDPFAQAVFPDLRKMQNLWSDREWMVQRSSAIDDPTCRVMQLWGSPTGARPNVVIFDDLYDGAVVKSEGDAKSILNWVLQSVLSRFGLNRDTQVIWLTNAWHDRDPVVLIEEQQRDAALHGHDPLWRIVRYPLLDSHGRSRYPGMIPDTAIPRLRQEFQDRFSVVFELQAVADDRRTFGVEVLDQVFRRNVVALETLDTSVAGDERFDVVISVDPATGDSGQRRKKKKSDRHGLTVILADQEASVYRLLWSLSGRWPIEHVALILLQWHVRFWPRAIVVEDNLCADWLRKIVMLVFMTEQQAAQLDGRICPYVMPNIVGRWTGKEKWDGVVGIRSLVREFKAGRHYFPKTASDPDVAESLVRLRDGFFGFTDSTHTADEVMSYWVGIEQCRKLALGRRSKLLASQTNDEASSGVKTYSLDTNRGIEQRLPFASTSGGRFAHDPYGYLR